MEFKYKTVCYCKCNLYTSLSLPSSRSSVIARFFIIKDLIFCYRAIATMLILRSQIISSFYQGSYWRFFLGVSTDLFRLLRRNTRSFARSAIVMTATTTPAPMPASAPVDKWFCVRRYCCCCCCYCRSSLQSRQRTVGEAERVDGMIERTSKSVFFHLTWIISTHAVGCDNVAASTVVVLPIKTTPMTIPIRRLL